MGMQRRRQRRESTFPRDIRVENVYILRVKTVVLTSQAPPDHSTEKSSFQGSPTQQQMKAAAGICILARDFLVPYRPLLACPHQLW